MNNGVFNISPYYSYPIIIIFALIVGFIIYGKYLNKLRAPKYRGTRAEFEDIFKKAYEPDNTTFHQLVQEVPQGECDWVQGDKRIATGHVVPCTLLTGRCIPLEMAFICHADTPPSATGIKDFVEGITQDVLALSVNQPVVFECYLIGGRSFCVYPFFARDTLLTELRKYEKSSIVKFDVVEFPMSRITFSTSINARTGEYDSYLKNTVRRRNVCDLFKPMSRSSLKDGQKINRTKCYLKLAFTVVPLLFLAYELLERDTLF
mgnify:CR=1 FL=1